MQRALSFDASPRLHVPLRFMLTAPLFALLAAAVLLWAGPSALGSRWNGTVLALTHLFVIGVLANVMAGAMLQILPVATGTRALATPLTATAVHVLINLGTLILAGAFLFVTPSLFGMAVVLLGLGLGWLAVAVIGGIWAHRKTMLPGAPTIVLAVRLSLVSLLVTILLGATLAGSMAMALPLPRMLTDLHAGWGLLGWVGLLIIGISFQVIPMFQVTERYPRHITRWLALAIFIVLGILTANTLTTWTSQQEAQWFIGTAALAGYLVYAGVTFDLLRGRKRPAPDTTTLFWRTALVSVALCLPVWLAHIMRVGDFSVLLGVLFIAGFAWSAVNGMLYKILPFLLWYNTQRDLDVALPMVPKVKHFIPDDLARPQVHAHRVAVALLALAAIVPATFTHVAALALAVSVVWLMKNIWQGLALYTSAGKEIRAELTRRAG